jgi:hypothetical protein
MFPTAKKQRVMSIEPDIKLDTKNYKKNLYDWHVHLHNNSDSSPIPKKIDFEKNLFDWTVQIPMQISENESRSDQKSNCYRRKNSTQELESDSIDLTESGIKLLASKFDSYESQCEETDERIVMEVNRILHLDITDNADVKTNFLLSTNISESVQKIPNYRLNMTRELKKITGEYYTYHYWTYYDIFMAKFQDMITVKYNVCFCKDDIMRHMLNV